MRKAAVINTCVSGSTGKIASGLAEYLNNIGYDTVFCFGRENGEVKVEHYRIGSKADLLFHVLLTRLTGLQGYGSRRATKKLIKYLINRSVDTVFIISLHGYYLNEKLFLDYLAESGVKVVYIMVDEYAFLGKCPYNFDCERYKNGCAKCPRKKDYPSSFFLSGASVIYKMKEKEYPKLRDVTFVGPEYVVLRAKDSPLMAGARFAVLDEAIDTDLFSPQDASDLLAELGIDERKIVLIDVARYSDERKGCKYFLELAKRMESNDDYVFIHVGFDGKQSRSELPKNFIPVGFIKDQKMLAKYYSVGDLLIFTSLEDTMPNTCLEALSVGTPVMCFDISGMPYIGDETVATFVEVGNVDEMERYVLSMKKKDEQKKAVCRRYALKRYDNKMYFKKIVCIVDGKSVGEGEDNDTF